jgi:hypothetical protein
VKGVKEMEVGGMKAGTEKREFFPESRGGVGRLN